jgi:hypothetical protein
MEAQPGMLLAGTRRQTTRKPTPVCSEYSQECCGLAPGGADGEGERTQGCYPMQRMIVDAGADLLHSETYEECNERTLG